jgi:L-lactate dehydrogenase complex protein LldG
MEESTTREKIFKSIRNALIEKMDTPYPNVEFETSVYPPLKELAEVTFAQEFTRAGGKFVYCEDESDMGEKLNFILSEFDSSTVFCLEESLFPLLDDHDIKLKTESADIGRMVVGITLCEFLIARLGSVMVSSFNLSGRRMNVFPDVHIIIACTSQMVDDLKDAFRMIREKYPERLPSTITTITGPSRTADIEKTLVMGAHGPRQLYLLLVDDTTNINHT